jgi:hypothetical protein
MWKSKNVTDGEAPGKSEEWEPQPPVSLTNSPVTTVDWGYGEGILSAFSTSELSILSETVLRKKMKETIMVLQISNTMVEIRRLDRPDHPFQVNTGMRIKGLDISEKHLVCWNG